MHVAVFAAAVVAGFGEVDIVVEAFRLDVAVPFAVAVVLVANEVLGGAEWVDEVLLGADALLIIVELAVLVPPVPVEAGAFPDAAAELVSADDEHPVTRTRGSASAAQVRASLIPAS